MLKMLGSFIFALLLTSTGFSQNLCSNLFRNTFSAEQIQVNKLKRIAREVRAQKTWYRSIDKIEISSALLKETIDYTLENLIKTRTKLPDHAEHIEMYDFTENADKTVINVVTSADKVLIDKLISAWQTILSSEKVNYIQYLNLTYVSVWALSPPSITDGGVWKIGATHIGAVKDNKINWDIYTPMSVGITRKLFKAEPYNVPVIVKDFFDFDNFMDLWIYGVRPIGLDYSEIIKFDGREGSPIVFLNHDVGHYSQSTQKSKFNSANIKSKQNERVIFSALLKKLKSDNLDEKKIYNIKYALFHLLHEEVSTLAGHMKKANLYITFIQHQRSGSEERSDGVSFDEYNEARKYIYEFLISQRKP